MNKLILLILLGTACFAETLSFEDHSKSKLEMSLPQLREALTVEEVTVWEPHEDRDVKYLAFDFAKLLTHVYGQKWKKTQEVLFTCSDGYSPSLPLKRFLDHKAYLAFERKDAQFILKDRFHGNEERVLGPYYLIWDNRQDAVVKAEGPSGWPWGLVKIDLIQFLDKFPHMAPSKTASPSAERGFLVFRDRCLSCHSINGEGGTKVELNRPVSVTRYFAPKYLRQWILDPSSVRENAAMPKFNRSLPHWSRDVDDVIEYLKNMATSR